jgi:hypothetical protein
MNKKIILPFIFAFLLLISFVFAAEEDKFTPTESQLVSGFSATYKLSYYSVFKFDNNYFTFKLYQIRTDSGIFRLYHNSSYFIEKELFVGDTWKFDLNNDDYYDFQAVVESRTTNSLKINLEYIHEVIAQDVVISEDETPEVITAENIQTNTNEEESELMANPIGALDLNNTEDNDETEESSSSLWVWIVLVIIATTVIVYYINKPKKKFRY